MSKERRCESCGKRARFTVEWPDLVQFEVCLDCLPTEFSDVVVTKLSAEEEMTNDGAL